jgi:transposase
LAPGYDTLPERRWQYLAILSFLVWLIYAPRRVNCPRCGIKAERLPWSDGKSPYSLPLMHFLARWARRISWLECAKVFRVSWDAVYHSVQWLVDFGLKHRKLDAVEAIGVDELHWRKGKKSENFLTLVYQVCANQRRLLWVGKTRKEATLKHGLNALEAECPGLCSRIKVACSDMWKPFLNVLRVKLPKSLNVLDRFHIVGHLNKAVDEVRRGEQAKLGKAARQRVKGGRFTLLRRGSRVRGKAREKLNDMLYSLQDTATAWMLKEAFGRFWKYRSHTWANAWLGNWIELTKRKGLKPMVRVAKMLERHRDLLMNYFRARREFSSAVVEGLNNKARVSLAKSYGHRSYDVLEVALYHALGDLPEPPLTHKFC